MFDQIKSQYFNVNRQMSERDIQQEKMQYSRFFNINAIGFFFYSSML